jgi:beta-phosphoglucomutase-like phosphatase (HAD superfamily)
MMFDHDGVLVDTEHWYYKAGERALAEIGLLLDPDQYLLDMSKGAGTWAQAKAAGVDGHTIDTRREVPNACYRSTCGPRQ